MTRTMSGYSVAETYQSDHLGDSFTKSPFLLCLPETAELIRLQTYMYLAAVIPSKWALKQVCFSFIVIFILTRTTLGIYSYPDNPGYCIMPFRRNFPSSLRPHSAVLDSYTTLTLKHHHLRTWPYTMSTRTSCQNHHQLNPKIDYFKCFFQR